MVTSVLPALGIITGSAQQTRLITPYQDGTAAYTAFLALCRGKLRSIIYGCTLQVFFDSVIAIYRMAGSDVKIIFDHTQASGAAETAQIQRLRDAGMIQGQHFVIGTSPKQHQIVHLKATVLDDLHVEDGSWNYSASADHQINDQVYSVWPELAAYYQAAFDMLWAWIVANEPQP